MAILAFAAPVSGLRGKVGGNIFSANKAGPYLKAWGRGSNPRTSSQTVHRANLIRFSKSWSFISQAQRDGWDTYAALTAQDKINSLGETYSASGFAWFIEINLARNQAGQGQRNSAPVLAIPGTPVIQSTRFDTTDSASDSAIGMTVGSPNQSFKHFVHYQVVSSKGKNVFSPIRRFMTISDLVGTRQVFFQTEAEDAFGTLFLGQKGFATIGIQNTEGRRGALVSTSQDLTET